MIHRSCALLKTPFFLYVRETQFSKRKGCKFSKQKTPKIVIWLFWFVYFFCLFVVSIGIVLVACVFVCLCLSCFNYVMFCYLFVFCFVFVVWGCVCSSAFNLWTKTLCSMICILVVFFWCWLFASFRTKMACSLGVLSFSFSQHDSTVCLFRYYLSCSFCLFGNFFTLVFPLARNRPKQRTWQKQSPKHAKCVFQLAQLCAQIVLLSFGEWLYNAIVWWSY